MLLIAKPSVEMFTNPASLIAMAAALCVALVDLALRNLGRSDDPLTTVFYFILTGVVVSAPYTLMFGPPLQVDLMPWLIGIGIFTALQQVAKTDAFRHAEASLLAPYAYSAIVWATILGWFIWNELPSLSVILGTAIVIGSNVYIAIREV